METENEDDMETKNNVCVICVAPIEASNDSVEHVIPHAIGGRWKVKGFICRPCNSRTGESWDSALTKQLEWLSSIIGVRRERGDTPNVPVSTMGGESLYLRSDGAYIPRRPDVEEIANGSTFNLSISGRSMGEVRQHARALKKKYPNAKIEEALAEMKMTRRYVEGGFNVRFQFGGRDANTSVIKTALAAAFALGIPPVTCDLALAYLRTLHDPQPVHFFLDRDLVSARPDDRFLHIVSIQADPIRRRALAYIDYFGLWRSVVVLSAAYEGPSLTRTYAIDPVQGETIELDADLSLTDDEVQAILDGADHSLEKWLSLYNQVIPKILARAEKRHIYRLIDEALDEVGATMGLSGDIPRDRQEAFTRMAYRLIAEKLTAMMLAKQRARDTR